MTARDVSAHRSWAVIDRPYSSELARALHWSSPFGGDTCGTGSRSTHCLQHSFSARRDSSSFLSLYLNKQERWLPPGIGYMNAWRVSRLSLSFSRILSRFREAFRELNAAIMFLRLDFNDLGIGTPVAFLRHRNKEDHKNEDN